MFQCRWTTPFPSFFNNVPLSTKCQNVFRWMFNQYVQRCNTFHDPVFATAHCLVCTSPTLCWPLFFNQLGGWGCAQLTVYLSFSFWPLFLTSLEVGGVLTCSLCTSPSPSDHFCPSWTDTNQPHLFSAATELYSKISTHQHHDRKVLSPVHLGHFDF